MRSPVLRLAAARLVVVAVALLGLAGSATAQTYTWSGLVDNDWSTPGNWNPAATPAAGSTVLFDASSAANLGTTLNAASFSIGTVQLTSVASPVSVGGTGTLTLTGATGFDLSAAASDLTVTAPLTVDFAGNQVWSVVGGRTLSVGATTLSATTAGLQFNGSGTTTFTGTLTTNAVGALVNATGAGAVTLQGVTLNSTATFQNTGSGSLTAAGPLAAGSNLVTFSSGDVLVSGVVSGTGGLSKTGAGTLTLSNAADSYTDVTTISSGVLSVPSLSLGGANGPLGAASNASANLVIDSGTLRVTTSGTAATDRGFTLGNNGGGIDVPNGTAMISGVAAGSNSAALVKLGNGTLVLSGANTFTGPVTVAVGRLVAANNAALGTAASGTTVSPGATLDVAGTQAANGLNLGSEVIGISGTGVGGNGALVNTGVGQQSALQFVTLTGDATINAGLGIVGPSFQNVLGNTFGRFDVRLAAYTAGAQNLNLGTFTLTKEGPSQFSLVNADVAGGGSIVVNRGFFGVELATQMTTPGTGTITVNPNGELEFFSYGGSTNLKPVVLNGGQVGDHRFSGTGAAQTIPAAITITGSQNPTFWATSGNVTTFSGPISESSFSGTGIAKRGAGTLAFTNPGNSFASPITVYQGTLRADFATGLATGGVPSSAAPTTALTTTDTPLGTNGTITLVGGTIAIRANMANDATNQQFDLQRNIVLDLAPGGLTFDRVLNTSQTDKMLLVPQLTFAPSSAANGYAIGQNQLTFTQGNNHRLSLVAVTMNGDTVLGGGDYNVIGDITSASGSTLIKTGGTSMQFTAAGPSGSTFGAFYHLGTSSLRVGTGAGTPATSTTVTVGSGPIYIGPTGVVSFLNPNNLAPGQTVEFLSQATQQAGVNFEGGFNAGGVPVANIRALGSGVLGVGNANIAAANTIDLSRIGDGTFRIGSGISAAGNGTISATILSGAPARAGYGLPGSGPGVVRVGALGTTTISGTNAITGPAALDVGSPLVNGGFNTVNNASASVAQNGTALLSAANNYTGGTTVNRGSTLRFQDPGSLGTGPVSVFGTITAESAGDTGPHGTFLGTGPVTLLGGSTIRFVNDPITSAATPDRWGDTTPITLTAATLEMRNRNTAAASDTIEVVGAMTIAGGSGINLQRPQALTGVTDQLVVASLTRSGQGTIDLNRSTGTGAGYGGGQRFIVSTGAPTAVNGMTTPWIVAQNNGPTDFVTYGANGFAVIAYDNTVTTGTYTPGALDYNGVSGGKTAVTTAALTLADNPTLYVLRTDQSINSSGTFNTITLRNSGLSSASTGTVTVGPSLVFNDGTANNEAIVYTRSGGTLQFNGTVTANGLTKFGAGTLSLFADGATTLTGNTSVNQGVLQLFGTATTNASFSPAGTGTILLNGGQLNVRTANAAGTTFSTSNNGSYVLQAGLAVVANIPIATLDVNRSSADTTSSGTFTFNPVSAGSPGLVLNGSPGPQGQTFNLSGANYAVTFGSNANNAFAGNVTINNAVTLTLNNAPTYSALAGGPAPVVTKSGTGSWIVGSVAGSSGAPVGTTVVLNAGTLELRSVVALGTGDQTSLVLNQGTLNLRRDSAGSYGTTGSGTRYGVTVNGNATISTDRVSAGTNFAENLGALTVNGNPTVTFNNGNGIYPTFTSVNLLGTPVLASNVTVGSVESGVQLNNVSGGALVKTGATNGFLHLMTANTYDGGTYLQAGFTRVRAAGALGTGNVVVNPGGGIVFNGAYTFAAGQTMTLRSNGAYNPVVGLLGDVAPPTADAAGAPSGVLALGNNGAATAYNTALDLSTVYGGGWSLGAVPGGAFDGRYTAAGLGAGAGNTYRLGGGGGSLNVGYTNAGVAQNNVLTGTASLKVGFDSGNILPANGTSFRVDVGGSQSYSGGTVVHRGSALRLGSAPVAGVSGVGTGPVKVYGGFALGNNATLVSGGSPTNTVVLHPGSSLTFDNNNGLGLGTAANVADRFPDGTPVLLNGALIDLIGNNNNASSESLGAVTIARGARLRAGRVGTGSAVLTLDSLSGLTPGNTLSLLASAAGNLGNAALSDRIFVTNGAPAVINGMVDPRIISQTDNSFVTYGPNGFAPVSYDVTITGGTYPAGSTLPTLKVDVTTAALTLTDNPIVYAMRSSQSINVGGPNNTITLRGGGLVATGGTIQPNLVFNDGTANVEARIYNSGTVTLNGLITANGVTKFGTGLLVVGGGQPQYAGGWTVNAGTLQINDLNGLGQTAAGNGVVLNPGQTTGGALAQAIGITQLTLNRDTGSPELAVFSGGPITVVNEGTVRIAANTNDRNLQSPPITALSTGADSSVSLTLDVPNNRFRAYVPSLTLAGNTTLRVLDSGSTTDFGRVTAAVVQSLVGSGVGVTKIGNRTLELPNDNSGTFTNGTITVAQGTVRVWNNGALGSTGSTTTVQRNAALEIGVPNFAPAATVVQLPGSVERWDVPNVRGASGTYNLPAGVNLQLNTNIPNSSTLTVGLNGGSLEGFLYLDHPATVADRVVGTGVTVNLLANSFVGTNILQGVGYDTGRQPTVFQPFANAPSGAVLRVNGNVTGSSFDLTKTGLDTVVLAGSANTYRNTIVDMGLLRIGRADALPTGGTLTTRFAGVFDLFGFNQTVGGLGTTTGGPNQGGVGLGDSGQVVSSGVLDATLTVNAATDFTYNGTLDRTVALTKAGAGTLTLGSGNSSYLGATTLNAGVLSVGTLANGGSNSSIGASPNAATSLVFGGGTLRYTGGGATTDRRFTLNAGGGTVEVAAPAAVLTVTGAGSGPGGLTKAGPGTLALTGANTYTGNTTVSAGTLTLSGGGSFAASPVVAVGSGTTLGVSGVTGGANFDATTNRFALASGQSLQGTGTVAGGATVLGGASIAPGTPASFGTLAVTGSATFNNSGSLAAKLGAPGTADLLNMTGGSATLDFVTGSKVALTGGAGFAAGTYGTYTLATMTTGNGAGIQLDGTGVADGFVLGQFVVGTGNSGPVVLDPTGLTGLASGETLTLSRSGDAVILSYQPVPEPATVLGIAAAAAGLGGLTRRRLLRRAAK